MSSALQSLDRVKQHVRAPRPHAEFDLLVAISSPGLSLDRTLVEDIDWDALLIHARHHSLMPLLAHRLLEAGVSLPSSIRARLRTEFQSNLLRNFGLMEEIKRILAAWEAAGIEVIPYKGPVMAEQLWGSFALRECSDLDFLVRREDVERAGLILADLGYNAVSPIAKSLRPALLRNASEEQFRHSSTNILLELQWAPAPRTMAVSYDERQLWRNSTKAIVAGRTVTAPSPEELLGLLVIHGWKHNWAKLIWIADVAALIHLNNIDWEQVFHSASRNGWRRILLLGIAMTRKIYRLTDLPCDTDEGITALANDLHEHLPRATPISYVEWHRDMLRARDCRTHQLRQLRNFVLSPGLGEYATVKLPRWASPAYRLIRLGRVLSLWPAKSVE